MAVRRKAAATARAVTAETVARRPARAARQGADEAVLATAEKLFAQYGFEAVTTKQLATAAGVTIGAIYHHFPSKEALYEAAARRVFARRPPVPKALFDDALPAEQRLTQLVFWLVSGIVSDRNFGLLLRREMLDPRAGIPTLADIEVFQQAQDLFRALVRQLVPDADLDRALASILALVFGFASLKGIQTVVPSVRKTLSKPAEVAELATQLLLRGLGA